MVTTTEQTSTKLPPAYWRLWSGQAVSLFGDEFFKVVLLWYAGLAGLAESGSLGLAMALPIAIFGMFGGVIADWFPRVWVMIISDLSRAAAAALAAIMLALDPTPSFAALLAVAALLVTLGLPFRPAVQAAMPDLVGADRNRLVAADAWLMGMTLTVAAAGPAIAGLSFGLGMATLLAFDAASFVFSAAMIWSLRNGFASAERETRTDTPTGPDAPATTATRSAGSEWRGMSLGTLVGTLLRRVLDGLRFAMRHPVLRPSFLTFPVMEAVLFSLSFFLPQLLHGRGHSVQTLGVLLTVWTVGRVCGLLAFRSGWLKLRRSLVFRINFVFQGLAVLVIASSGSLVVMGAAFLLLGLPAGAAQVAMSTYLQTEVPRELRAQAFACLSSIVTWCAPLGPVLLGLVGSAFGVTPVFAVIGAVLLAGGVFLASRRSFAQLD